METAFRDSGIIRCADGMWARVYLYVKPDYTTLAIITGKPTPYSIGDAQYYVFNSKTKKLLRHWEVKC